MGSAANVKSIAAIRRFRADLQTYEDSLRQTLDMLAAELKRAVDYFESDRAAYWPAQVRRASDRVAEARINLERCQVTTHPGEGPTCYEEKKALERAKKLGNALGPYTLQAAIAACHARARTAEETDWPQIAALYDALAQLTPSPIIELNRAVALGMAYGPTIGLELVDLLKEEPSLANYHLLPSVRGDLLAKLGRTTEARAEFRRAAALTQNERERNLLLARAHESIDD